jgi:hypothetical protein
MNIFEQATRKALRFATTKGEITTEQLWDLPLQSRSGFDLDAVAKTVSRELKSMAEESFVTTSENPASALLELKLEVLKHIIAVKLEEAEAARSRAARAEEKQKLLKVLGDKQDEALKALTPEEIAERLKALG